MRSKIILLALLIYLTNVCCAKQYEYPYPGVIFEWVSVYEDVKYEKSDMSKVSMHIKFQPKYDLLYGKHPSDFKWQILDMPSNATFDEKYRIFRWQPNSSDSGLYSIKFIVTYNGFSDTMVYRISIIDQWESAFMPGLAAMAYMPDNRKELGVYRGISVNYLFYSWIHCNEKQGGSHGNFYFKLDVLMPEKKDSGTVFIYGFGLTSSFERNARRKFLIPFYGLEFSGLSHKAKSSVVFTPLIGVWLFSTPAFQIELQAGYHLPVKLFDDYKGFRSSLGLNLTFM